MKILFRWLLMGVLVFGFVGCSKGGGGGTTAPPNEDTKSDVNTTTIKLVVNELNLNSLENYKIISSNDEVNSSNEEINISKDTKDVVALIDEGGEPILIGRKYSGDDTADLSLESSAEMFVLYFPRFNGLSSNNPKELSNRIRSNSKFPNLIESIKNAINKNNPCPLDPICNYEAKEIAFDIANSLKLDDLYEDTK